MYVMWISNTSIFCITLTALIVLLTATEGGYFQGESLKNPLCTFCLLVGTCLTQRKFAWLKTHISLSGVEISGQLYANKSSISI